jgi:hypothetical protein
LLVELPLEGYITHEFGPEAAAEAYARLDRRDPDVLQCVFVFAQPAVGSRAVDASLGEHGRA